MFDDIEDDAFELDEQGSDRQVLHHIWTLHEMADDLWAGEGWAVMQERYPEEPVFRLLAAARLAESSGVAPSVAALRALMKSTPEELAGVAAAVLVVMTNHAPDAEARDDIEDLARSAGATLDLEEAYGAIDRLEAETLALGERRTAGDRPWKAKAAPPPLDYAAALALYLGEPRPYSPRDRFAVGDRVAHDRFGLGVVVGVAPARMTVLFPDSTKKLVCA